MTDTDSSTPRLAQQRARLLIRFRQWMEVPLLVLGFVWLVLLVVELTSGLHPMLQSLSTTIWIIFIVAFLVELALAPRKLAYLRSQWLTVLSLALPALRVLRIARTLRVLRAARAVRGARLLRVVTGLNRGMRALGRSMGRRGFGYVSALTLIVIVAGAAGMLALEREASGGLPDYASALWFTIMLLTTIGSEYWPRTPEGRLLCLLLSLYAIGVFGYITAALASFFVDRDREERGPELASEDAVQALRMEIIALRQELGARRP
ncbi:MAG TPA: ion transporter [Gemmatimonadaceae bacterium]|nr:ion transporter [Gemmatimonadaceae bacterium]